MGKGQHDHESSHAKHAVHHEHASHHAAKNGGIGEEEINDGLAAIYGDDRDDLSKLDRGGSRLTSILLKTVIVLAVIAVIAFVSFFVYLRFFRSASVDPLTLEVQTVSEAVSGTTQTITVHYANSGRVPMAALAIDVNLPKAFKVTSMTPQPTDPEEFVWNIGTFSGNSDQSIVLEGTWIAEVPSSTTVQALATFRPGNFNSDFEKVASATVSTLASNLALTMTGPEDATPGEQVSYDIVLENKGDLPFTHASILLALPPGFFVESTNPALEAGAQPKWEIAEIAAKATQTVTVKGSFAADISDVQQITAKVAVQDGDLELTQSEASVFTDVVGNGLGLQLVANGTAGDVTVDPGEPLRLTVGYTNTGEATLSGVSLLVDFQSENTIPITWSEATLDGGRLTQDGIRFDAATVGSLAANEKKSRNLIFPVREELKSGDAQSWTVLVHATVGGVTIKSQPLTISLNSDAAFTAVSRYYSETGAPLGSGSLPPKVGQTTTYQVVWSIGNSVHALEDVRVSATVPAGVNWDNEITAEMGSVSYDDATRTVTWNIAGIAADAGEVTATLELSITPDTDDVGRFVKLLSGSAFRATDLATGSTLQQAADALTTECEGDEGAEGKGTVED